MSPKGAFELWAGSIAVHLLERSFIERLVQAGSDLPFHRAIKKVPYVTIPRAARVNPPSRTP